ncbi:MAG: phage portal protein [Victivallaceae bacterium]|jgi:capsid protein
MQLTKNTANITITCGPAASGYSLLSDKSAPSAPSGRSPAPAGTRRGGIRVMQARYDAAMTNSNNQRHWMMADGLSADQANSPGVRETLRNRSRYECANSTHLKHMVRVNAYYMVGRVPQLEISNTDNVDEDTAQRIENDWTKWTERELLGRKLRTLTQSADRDGESFLQLFTNRKYANNQEVSLSVTGFEAQYLRNFGISSDYNEFNNIDGVILDDDGNPVMYCVQTNYYKPAIEIPAAQIVHWLKPDRPGQHRGIPETTAGLNLSAYRRDYTLSVMQAARNAADQAYYLKTNNAEEVDDNGAPLITVGSTDGLPDADLAAFETAPVDLSRGAINIMPYGTEPGMLKAEQPVNTYKDFNRETLCADAAGFSMPMNIATCDSSQYNFASGKLDFQFFATKISIEQYDFNLIVLDPIFAEWFGEYKLLPANADLRGLDTPEHEWMYDSADPVNPLPEAKAATERMANETSNLAIECGKSGRDWRDVVKKSIQIEKFRAAERKAAGLPDLAAPTSPTRPPSPAKSDSSDPTAKQSGDNNE